jgi:hypothetical protein
MKISKKVLQKFVDYSKKLQGVNQLDDFIMDHRQAENPYLSLYGEESEQKIKRSVSLAAYILIADMR